MRKLLNLLVILIISLLIASYSILYLDFNNLKKKVINNIKNNLHADIEINGDIKIHILPTPRIILNNNIINIKRKNYNIDITGEKIILIAKFTNFFSIKNYNNIILDNVNIKIEALKRNSKNKFNPERKTGLEILKNIEIYKEVNEILNSNLAINKIIIKNSIIDYINKPKNYEKILKNISLNIEKNNKEINITGNIINYLKNNNTAIFLNATQKKSGSYLKIKLLSEAQYFISELTIPNNIEKIKGDFLFMKKEIIKDSNIIIKGNITADSSKLYINDLKIESNIINTTDTKISWDFRKNIYDLNINIDFIDLNNLKKLQKQINENILPKLSKDTKLNLEVKVKKIKYYNKNFIKNLKIKISTIIGNNTEQLNQNLSGTLFNTDNFYSNFQITYINNKSFATGNLYIAGDNYTKTIQNLNIYYIQPEKIESTSYSLHAKYIYNKDMLYIPKLNISYLESSINSKLFLGKKYLLTNYFNYLKKNREEINIIPYKYNIYSEIFLKKINLNNYYYITTEKEYIGEIFRYFFNKYFGRQNNIPLEENLLFMKEFNSKVKLKVNFINSILYAYTIKQAEFKIDINKNITINYRETSNKNNFYSKIFLDNTREHPNIIIDIQGNRLDLNRFFLYKPKDFKFNNQLSALPILNKSKIHFNLDIENFIFRELLINEFNCNFDINNNFLKTNKFLGKIYNEGYMQMEFTASLDRVISIKTNYKFTDTPLEPIISFLFIPPSLGGTANMKGKLETRGSNLLELMQNLNSSNEIELTKPYIKNIQLKNLILKIIQLYENPDAIQAFDKVFFGGNSFFREGYAKVEILKGLLYLTKLNLHNKNSSLFAIGKLNIPTTEIISNIILKYPGMIRQKHKIISVPLSSSIVITGSLKKPIITFRNKATKNFINQMKIIYASNITKKNNRLKNLKKILEAKKKSNEEFIKNIERIVKKKTNTIDTIDKQDSKKNKTTPPQKKKNSLQKKQTINTIDKQDSKKNKTTPQKKKNSLQKKQTINTIDKQDSKKNSLQKKQTIEQ